MELLVGRETSRRTDRSGVCSGQSPVAISHALNKWAHSPLTLYIRPIPPSIDLQLAALARTMCLPAASRDHSRLYCSWQRRSYRLVSPDQAVLLADELCPSALAGLMLLATGYAAARPGARYGWRKTAYSGVIPLERGLRSTQLPKTGLNVLHYPMSRLIPRPFEPDLLRRQHDLSWGNLAQGLLAWPRRCQSRVQREMAYLSNLPVPALVATH